MKWLAVWWVVCCGLGLTLATLGPDPLAAERPTALAVGYPYTGYAPDKLDAWGFPQADDTSWVAYRLQRLKFNVEAVESEWDVLISEAEDGEIRQRWISPDHDWPYAFIYMRR